MLSNERTKTWGQWWNERSTLTKIGIMTIGGAVAVGAVVLIAGAAGSSSLLSAVGSAAEYLTAGKVAAETASGLWPATGLAAAAGGLLTGFASGIFYGVKKWCCPTSSRIDATQFEPIPNDEVLPIELLKKSAISIIHMLAMNHTDRAVNEFNDSFAKLWQQHGTTDGTIKMHTNSKFDRNGAVISGSQFTDTDEQTLNAVGICDLVIGKMAEKNISVIRNGQTLHAEPLTVKSPLLDTASSSASSSLYNSASLV